MTFSQGTIESTNPAYQTALTVTELLNNAGWQVVDQGSLAELDYRVFKSAGSLSENGYDWHVTLMWTPTGAGTFRLLYSEGYDATNKKLIAPAPSGAAMSFPNAIGITPVKEDGTSFGDWSLETGTYDTPVPRTSASIPPGYSKTVPTTPFAYWARASRNTVVFSTLINDVPETAVGFTIKYQADIKTGPLGDLPTARAVFRLDANAYSIQSDSPKNLAIQASSVAKRPAGFAGHTANVSWYEPRGVQLPTTTGALNAQAVRPSYTITSLINTTETEILKIGQPQYIGASGEDFIVWGGAVGDGIEIDGVQHILLPLRRSQYEGGAYYYAAEVD